MHGWHFLPGRHHADAGTVHAVCITLADCYGCKNQILPPPPQSGIAPIDGHCTAVCESEDGISNPAPQYWPESQVSDGRGGRGGGRKVSMVHEPIRQFKRARVPSPKAVTAKKQAIKPAARATRTRGNRMAYGKLGLVSVK